MKGLARLSGLTTWRRPSSGSYWRILIRGFRRRWQASSRDPAPARPTSTDSSRERKRWLVVVLLFGFLTLSVPACANQGTTSDQVGGEEGADLVYTIVEAMGEGDVYPSSIRIGELTAAFPPGIGFPNEAIVTSWVEDFGPEKRAVALIAADKDPRTVIAEYRGHAESSGWTVLDAGPSDAEFALGYSRTGRAEDYSSIVAQALDSTTVVSIREQLSAYDPSRDSRPPGETIQQRVVDRAMDLLSRPLVPLGPGVRFSSAVGAWPEGLLDDFRFPDSVRPLLIWTGESSEGKGLFGYLISEQGQPDLIEFFETFLSESDRWVLLQRDSEEPGWLFRRVTDAEDIYDLVVAYPLRSGGSVIRLSISDVAQ